MLCRCCATGVCCGRGCGAKGLAGNPSIIAGPAAGCGYLKVIASLSDTSVCRMRQQARVSVQRQSCPGYISEAIQYLHDVHFSSWATISLTDHSNTTGKFCPTFRSQQLKVRRHGKERYRSSGSGGDRPGVGGHRQPYPRNSTYLLPTTSTDGFLLVKDRSERC